MSGLYWQGRKSTYSDIPLHTGDDDFKLKEDSEQINYVSNDEAKKNIFALIISVAVALVLFSGTLSSNSVYSIRNKISAGGLLP